MLASKDTNVNDNEQRAAIAIDTHELARHAQWLPRQAVLQGTASFGNVPQPARKDEGKTRTHLIIVNYRDALLFD